MSSYYKQLQFTVELGSNYRWYKVVIKLWKIKRLKPASEATTRQDKAKPRKRSKNNNKQTTKKKQSKQHNRTRRQKPKEKPQTKEEQTNNNRINIRIK